MPRSAVVLTADDETVKQDYHRLFSHPQPYRVEFGYTFQGASELIFSPSKPGALVIDHLFGPDDVGVLINIISREGLLSKMKQYLLIIAI